MAADIKLIVLDLDGTLMGRADEFHLYDDFAAKMAYFKAHYGTKWAVCTGRGPSGFRNFFRPMRSMGIAPDFVIFRHAYIWQRTRFGYLPRVNWNALILYRLWSNRLYVREALNQWSRMILGISPRVRIIYHKKDKLCVRFKSEENAVAVERILLEKTNAYNHLMVFRTMNEVDVRMIPFTKGLAVAELAERLGVSWNNTLAVGDGHSDMSMLDGEAAHFTGCPANAEIDVMAQVHKSGGHVARKRVLNGVLEILDAYLQDTVCSDLPEWWTPSFDNKGPRLKGSMVHTPKRKRRRVSSQKVTGWVVVLAGYVTLTVFASFGLIPFLSGLIMKPFGLLTKLVARIISAFAG